MGILCSRRFGTRVVGAHDNETMPAGRADRSSFVIWQRVAAATRGNALSERMDVALHVRMRRRPAWPLENVLARLHVEATYYTTDFLVVRHSRQATVGAAERVGMTWVRKGGRGKGHERKNEGYCDDRPPAALNGNCHINS
jgi:hypothetical protein